MFNLRRSSLGSGFLAKQALGFLLCLLLILPAPPAAAAQHTAKRSSSASASRRRASTNPARSPVRTLQVTPEGETVGSPWTGQPGVRETTSQIMRRQRAQGSVKPEPEETEEEKTLPPRDRLPMNPLSPQESQWPPRKKAEPTAPVLASPQTLSLSFTGATLGETGAFPPDTMGAVGPSQFVVAVNNRIKVFDKTTGAAGALNTSTNLFFNSVRNGIGTSDPRIRYDRLSERWFIIIITVSTPNRVLLAVSDNGTITASTVWTFFFFQQDQVSPVGESGCLSDYPTLGIDANALYIGVNQFCPSFGGTTGFVVRKSSVLGAGPIVASAFRSLTGTPGGVGPYTPQGVDNYDPAATEGYFIGVDNATFGTLVVRRVSNPGGTPVLSSNILITVPATSFPLTVPHLGNNNGTNGQLDALDDRLFAAHIRNGRLWTAQNISVDNTGTTVGERTRNAARWYELSGLNTGAPTVVQAGTLFAATPTNSTSDRHYWIPSIMVSGQGHAAMGASAAGTNEFINAATVGRLASDTLGSLQMPLLYTASASPYNPPGNTGDSRGRRRWGDYSYTSLDPCDDMTMWTIQEFCESGDSYGVRVVKLLAPPPVTPLSANPALVPQGQLSLNVTISGLSVGGRGFYDPGPGFACRLAASIGGGVVINNVTYNSPTSITLNISTVAALLGSKSISVTNADGQSANGSLITVGTPGSCSFTLDSAMHNFGAPGGGATVNLTTAAGCAWTATSNDGWISITSGGSGVGNGTVGFSAAPNPGGGARSGSMTIGGVTFIVTEDGNGVCAFSIAPTSQNLAASGGAGSVTVTADVGCAWTATSNAPWITITSGNSGTGNGTVNYSVGSNSACAPRSGTITIAGQTFTVNQAGVNCTFSLAPTTKSFTATGGSDSVSVTASDTCCVWTATSNDSWITITSGSGGTGSGTVAYSVGANAGAARSGTMTIGGQTFTVTQGAAPVNQGFLDAAGCGIITGWAWDANQPNTVINVDIFDGSTLITTIPANLFREDIVNAGIGNGFHGFSFTVPASLKNGVAHTIRAKFSGTSTELGNSPRVITCSGAAPLYQGFHDGAGCNTISGWAWDANDPNNPINVDIYDGTTLIATVPSIQFRPDLVTAGIGNGFHGFSYTVTSSLRDGQPHSIRVRFPGSATSLGNTPRTIQCNGALPIFEGIHEVANCNVISGWAWDRNDPISPINVAIFDGSQLVATVLAIQFRQDLVNAGIGNGYHAFTFNVPANLKDGQPHSIRVRYSGTTTSLGSTPRSITCSPP